MHPDKRAAERRGTHAGVEGTQPEVREGAGEDAESPRDAGTSPEERLLRLYLGAHRRRRTKQGQRFLPRERREVPVSEGERYRRVRRKDYPHVRVRHESEGGQCRAQEKRYPGRQRPPRNHVAVDDDPHEGRDEGELCAGARIRRALLLFRHPVPRAATVGYRRGRRGAEAMRRGTQEDCRGEAE